ncbi:MAG: hypothetical protein H0U84_06300 [Thermoleophilaceae bacterium]|nr:hypothetical protein [Thermoleophilaceae bacterium]
MEAGEVPVGLIVTYPAVTLEDWEKVEQAAFCPHGDQLERVEHPLIGTEPSR